MRWLFIITLLWLISSSCQNDLEATSFQVATSPLQAEYQGFMSLITLKPTASAKKFCSAVRIAPNFLLTSASCLYHKPNPKPNYHTPLLTDHNIVSIQHIGLSTSESAGPTVISLSPSQILAVDIFSQYTHDKTIPFLALHDLAIITTTLPPAAQDEFIQLASQDTDISISTAASLTIYGLDTKAITHSRGSTQPRRGVGVLAPDIFMSFQNNINKIDPQQSSSPQSVDRRKAHLLSELEYLTELFADRHLGLFMLRSISPAAAGPGTFMRLCAHNVGSAVTIMDANGQEQLLGILGGFGFRARLEYSFLINPQKHMIYSKNPAHVLVNSLICPDFTSVTFVPAYHHWIEEVITRRMLSLTDDGATL